ncbi:hypothetical protein [Puerhibacterium puerhi]|uniref:hypothetical protein n=1 Tax=Puerhibacterium puerhi TaxID=2692623 RepID=UPI001914EFC7|nr:hypothetical protein [Puerhibacterium puerhi]
MTLAMHKGGREKWVEHFGWTRDRYMMADFFDAMQFNTQATGNWKKKAPELPKYPRPKVVKKQSKPVTVADLHRAWMGKLMRDSGKGVTWQTPA